MALGTGSTKLTQALKTLRARWEETQTRWKDPVSRAFDKDQFTPLEAQVVATLRAIDRLARELDEAKRACS
jgi:hypothetical protein